MSDRTMDRPEDWRRRRRRSGSASRSGPDEPGGGPDQPEAGPGQEPDREVELTRTLFSFLEPVMDTIGSFGAPVVIAGIVGVVSGITLLAFVRSMELYGWINLFVGLGLIGLVAVISLSSVLAAFFSRTGRYGVNTAIMLAAFTGIVIVINVISFENHSRMDVTATNQFSLGDRTKVLLKELDEPVLATAFYKDDLRNADPSQSSEQAIKRIGRRQKVEETLKEFDARSSKFSFRMVDPDLSPVIVSSYFGRLPTGFVTESVVVASKDSGEFDVVQPTDISYSQLEQDLVTSILVATGQEKKAVYFLTGHGERSINSGQGDGYTSVRQGLEHDNYDVRTLPWTSSGDEVSVPAGVGLGNCATEEEPLPEAALVVVARPTGELPQAHAEALDLYLMGKMRALPECTAETQLEADGWIEDHGGPSQWDTVPVSSGEVQVWPKGADPSRLVDRRESGRMIFLAEPDVPQSFRQFLALWGVIVDPRHILDRSRSVEGDPYTLRLSLFNPEAPLQITVPRGERLETVFMPGTAALNLIPDAARFPIPLAGTSEDSYLSDDIERTEPITDAGDQSDPQGPFSPVVLVRAIGPLGTPAPVTTPPDSRISSMVVFGDSDFVANSFYGRGSGADLFLNSANYLMGDYSLVSIREKSFTFREFNLNRNEYNFVRFSSWLFLPGLLGLMAGLVWWLRR